MTTLLRILVIAVCLAVMFAEIDARRRRHGGKDSKEDKEDKGHSWRGGRRERGDKEKGGKKEFEKIGGTGRDKSKARRQRRRDMSTRTYIDENVCGRCRAEGDPHYYPFNGDKFDFQGACTYVLSERSSGVSPNCYFRVTAKNVPTDGDKPSITTTNNITIEFVDVNGTDVSIQLGPMENYYVDGVKVECDYDPSGNNYNLQYADRYCNLHLGDCGITIGFKKPNRAYVVVPTELAEGLDGMCGPCTGAAEDYCQNLAEGESFWNAQSSECDYSAFSDSFRTADDTECPEFVPEAVVTCTDDALINAREACGVIDLSDESSQFYAFVTDMGVEINSVKDAVDSELTSCIYDYCAYEQSGEELKQKKSLCRFVTSAVEVIADVIGLAANESMPCFTGPHCNEVLSCNANEEFVDFLSTEESCISDVPQPTVGLEVCGCQCETGYKRQGKKCVQECGCFDEDGGIQALNEIYLTKDCMEVRQCVDPLAENTHLISSPGGCFDDHTECGVKDGKRACVCVEGYESDGEACQVIEEPATEPATEPETEPEKESEPEPEVAPEPCVVDPSALIFTIWTGPEKEEGESYPACIEENDPNGYGFFGDVSVTRSGKTCQAWASQDPHRHHYSNLAEEGNNCRNQPYKGSAGTRDGGPWCYVTEGVDNWEYCYVPFCNAELNNDEPQTSTAVDIGCYDDNGEDYDGDAFLVHNAEPCDNWPAEYGLDHNKCRNPNGEMAMPWCLVNGKKTLCRIPLCVAVPAPGVPPPVCTSTVQVGLCESTVTMEGSGCMQVFQSPDGSCSFSVQQIDEYVFEVEVSGTSATIDSRLEGERSYDIAGCAKILTKEPNKVEATIAVCPVCAGAADTPEKMAEITNCSI